MYWHETLQYFMAICSIHLFREIVLSFTVHIIESKGVIWHCTSCIQMSAQSSFRNHTIFHNLCSWFNHLKKCILLYVLCNLSQVRSIKPMCFNISALTNNICMHKVRNEQCYFFSHLVNPVFSHTSMFLLKLNTCRPMVHYHELQANYQHLFVHSNMGPLYSPLSYWSPISLFRLISPPCH